MSETGKQWNVTGETLVCQLFAEYPAARAVFERHGYRGCGGPGGPAKPISVFSANHGVSLQRLLAEVREVACGDD